LRLDLLGKLYFSIGGPFIIFWVSVAMTSMEDEIQELRETVAKFNCLRLESELPGPSSVPVVTPAAVPDPPQPVETDFVVLERFVCMPRERQCPTLSGKFGTGIYEWVEEAEACMWARRRLDSVPVRKIDDFM